MPRLSITNDRELTERLLGIIDAHQDTETAFLEVNKVLRQHQRELEEEAEDFWNGF